jgi:hypothetical protein
MRLLFAARNNSGAADKIFTNSIRGARIGRAFNNDETTVYYQYVQALQDALGRAF